MKVNKVLQYAMVIGICFTIGNVSSFANPEGEEGEYEWIKVRGIDVMGYEGEAGIEITVEEDIPKILFNQVGGVGVKDPADESGFPAAAVVFEQEEYDGFTSASLVAKDGEVNLIAVDGTVNIGVTSIVDGEWTLPSSYIILDKCENFDGRVRIGSTSGAQIRVNENGGVEIILGQP